MLAVLVPLVLLTWFSGRRSGGACFSGACLISRMCPAERSMGFDERPLLLVHRATATEFSIHDQQP